MKPKVRGDGDALLIGANQDGGAAGRRSRAWSDKRAGRARGNGQGLARAA